MDKKLETALWWREMKRTNNEAFLPLFFDRHRYIVLKGGGGSGKSIFAGRLVLERVTTEPNHRWLVCRKVAKTLRESCFAQLIGQVAQYYPDLPVKINRSDMRITFPHNGSQILFAGLDDTEKLKSIYSVTGEWLEEASELERQDFQQLDIRLRDRFAFPKQMILSFNPISITHWLKVRFFDHPDTDATVHESTYKDNRFLAEESIRVLEGFRETDEYYYMVYCLGMWGVTGKTVFNGKKVTERLEIIRRARKEAAGSPLSLRDVPPQGGGYGGASRTPETSEAESRKKMPRRGLFEYKLLLDGVHLTDIRWVDDENGPVTIYREPEKVRPYVIGGDTAGEGSDWFTAQVLDNVSGHQVCVLRHQYDEDTYARQVYCLGKYYNDALIAVETNFSTYPVKLLDLMGYRNLYEREVEDNYDGTIRHAYGFRTDRITRPLIIAELVDIMREHLDCIEDENTLLEMLTFVRNEKQRPEAEPGAHDDLVMALAIAYYVRPQQRMEIKQAQTSARRKWTEDMWEDYRSGTAAQKAEMVRLWGEPR